MQSLTCQKRREVKLKRKLERMEDDADSPEITISVMRNSNTESRSTNPDEQPHMEHFEEKAAGDCAETMM
jgi:hypothetical protein